MRFIAYFSDGSWTGGGGEIMKEGKMENSEGKKNKEGTGDTEKKGKREEVKGFKGPVMTEPTVSGKGKSVRFEVNLKATLAKKSGTNLEGPLMTLAQHSANHDRSVANAMKYKEDTATLKGAEKITERACAAVAESAEIPYHLWRNHIEHVIPRIRLPEDWEQRVNPLRNCLLRWWRRRVTQSLGIYLRKLKGEQDTAQAKNHGVVWDEVSKTYKWKINPSAVNWHMESGYGSFQEWRITHAKLIIEAGRDCITRAAHSTWWKWDAGSRPFFWRFPREFRVDMMKGNTTWVKKQLPLYKRKAKHLKDPIAKEQLESKISKLRKYGYVALGVVKSVLDVFTVPKAEDIRPVYNGASSGLNDAIWAPWFGLPTVLSQLRGIQPGTFMGDADVGEMFHNFMLEESLQPYVGVDFKQFNFDPLELKGLTSLLSSTTQQEEILTWHEMILNAGGERWTRMCMGMRQSPYVCTQGLHRAEEVVKGDALEETNPFNWIQVVFNLPGNKMYDPKLPWIYRITHDGKIAADLFTYVDDQRCTGGTQSICWCALQKVAGCMSFLGLQSAARKRREVGQDVGAWAGSIVDTTEGKVRIRTDQEKWDKTREWIRKLNMGLEEGVPLNFKELERMRGFLIYVSRTYTAMTPYLKGLHQTIDSWRPYTREDGWRMSHREIDLFRKEGDGQPVEYERTEPPTTVIPVKD